jgi:ubiquinol-cytochrome c reductase cytochrome b subunit
VKDGFAMIVFLAVFCYFVFYMPNYMGHPDNYVPANSLVTPSHIVPEWYFLPFYAMLRAITFPIGPIDAQLGGVLVMFGSIIILFFVPWLDTSRVKSTSYRPIYRVFFWIFAINAVILGWLGSRPAEGIYPLLSLIGTIYYFGHFLIVLPVLGLIETPKKLPNSITEAVLAKNAAKAKPSPAGAEHQA